MNESYPLEKDSNPELKTYLHKISKGDGTFKRVLISPLRYAGGKSKAIGLILNNMPELQEKKIVSVFMGGGSFELTMSQHLGYKVIGYDIFEMLTNFWNVICEEKTFSVFINQLKQFQINKTEFTKNRHILLSYWDSPILLWQK